MGRWKGDTFKEYIRKELACFLTGMSKATKQKFKFVNIMGSAQGDLVDVLLAVVAAPRITPASAAALDARRRAAHGVTLEAVPTYGGGEEVDGQRLTA